MASSKAELQVYSYLDKATRGLVGMSDDTIEQVVSHIRDALQKQFSPREEKFRVRMSNIGRPYCQLWFQKNKPETAIHPSANRVMLMMMGDIVEAVFKGILTEAGVSYTDSKEVSLNVKGNKIKGTYDLVIDDHVDDIKSASTWSYTNKFTDFETVKDGDSFGYVGQLVGYAKASKKNVGGWWVINKNNAEFKYVSAKGLDIKKEYTILKDKFERLEKNKFERCFDAVDETFRGKLTGNKVLGKSCTFCDFRHACWEGIEERPSVMSQAKEPRIVSYVYLKEEYKNEK